MLYRALFSGQRPCCLLPGPFPHTTFHLVPFPFSQLPVMSSQLKRYNVEMSFFPAHALTTQLTFGCLAVYFIPSGLPFMKGPFLLAFSLESPSTAFLASHLTFAPSWYFYLRPGAFHWLALCPGPSSVTWVVDFTFVGLFLCDFETLCDF